jgi:hypothetical protein
MDTQVLRVNNIAVSEIVGAILLVFIAVVVSATIYTQMLPVPLPPPESNVHLMGYVNDNGTAIIKHMGGETLYSYEIHLIKIDENTTVYKYENYPWEIGESRIPPSAINLTENREVRVMVYSIYNDDSSHLVFDGILEHRVTFDEPYNISHPMLISTLRDDSIDEDLICYNYSMNPLITPKTYIYQWMLNGQPFYELLMPFDIENSTTVKDYSGNNLTGSNVGANWNEDGILGGCYYFNGASDYITTTAPSLFDDLSNNDFTISIWLRSEDIEQNFRMVLEGGNKTEKSFTKIFTFGSEIHFGVCQDGVKHAVRTESLLNNTWYHIVGVWDAEEKSIKIYINGVLSTKVGYRTYAMGIQGGLDLGHGTASSRFWLGNMDELEIYGRALSGEQVYQIYIDTKDGFSEKRVIVSEETSFGNIWQCIVTPNDGIQDGISVPSNILNIKTYSGGE